MTLGSALLSIAVAAAAGALVGAEREQAHVARQKADFGGVRTFPLLAMLGAMGALLGPVTGHWFVLALLGAVVVSLAISQARMKSDDVGVSSEIAAIVTFGMGIIAEAADFLPDQERFLLVAGIAAVTMALLALKQPLHGFIARVSHDDVFATVKFVLLALVVMPLLPNRTYGPLDVLNPRKIGLMIMLVAGVSFAGYVAARVVGSRRGLLLTGLIGGVVSSTALTLALAARAKQQPALVRGCSVAIVAACATMFARMLAIVALLDRPLLAHIALPVGVMAIAGYAFVIFAYRRAAQHGKSEEVSFHNPFELRQAFLFGLVYATILFAAKAAAAYIGRSGLYASAALSGLADVDAITISLAEIHRAGTPASVVATAVALAAVTNTLGKAAMATLAGGRPLGKQVAVPLTATLAAGATGMGAQIVLCS